MVRAAVAGRRAQVCSPPEAIAAAAGVPDQSLQVRQRVRQAIEALTAEIEKEGERGATPAADAAPPADQIAGVPVAEAQPKGDAKAAGKKKAAAKKEAPPAAAPKPAPAEPPPAKSPFDAKPTEGGFAEVVQDIDQRQQAARHPAEPRFREEQQVPAVPGEPLTYVPLSPQENPAEPPSDLDTLVRLLTEPPMPSDIGPFCKRRRPQDRHFADSAYIRLFFGEALPPRYAKDPNYEPPNPTAPRIDLYPDEGFNERLAAAVEMLFAIHEHARGAGLEIPQLAAFLDVYEDRAEVCRAAKAILEKQG